MKTLTESLAALTVLRVGLTLRARDPLVLPPYKGSTFRGGFGTVFKETVCVVEHRDCARCLLRTRCAFPYVFDTPIPEGTTRMRKYTSAPHPFVLLPPLEETTLYRPGDVLPVDITLIGKGAEFLPYFIYTFERLGERRGLGKGRGRFAVDSVTWRSPEGEEVEIYSGAEKTLRNTYRSVSVQDLPTFPFALSSLPSVTVRFVTPTRIVYGEALTTAVDFHVLIRVLLRRVANLSYFHCGTELDLDFRALIAAAEQIETADSNLRWYDWERYSARQDARMKMGGVVGHVTYRGNLHPFLPLLRLGEAIHVGKGTSFGLGKYEIQAETH
ncbi:MAG: CRISPR system precrRNA processing endoribonuclease RAMP protein Cas6 [Candidatus Binatia bacterium]